ARRRVTRGSPRLRSRVSDSVVSFSREGIRVIVRAGKIVRIVLRLHVLLARGSLAAVVVCVVVSLGVTQTPVARGDAAEPKPADPRPADPKPEEKKAAGRNKPS